MHNDPELNGKYLGTITKDFVIVSEMLKEAAYQVRERGFSEFPIFPICKEETAIGQPFIKKTDLALLWNFNITYLDEFLQRGLIEDEEKFKKTYKNPNEYCCLFVIDNDFTNFVFLPYPED